MVWGEKGPIRRPGPPGEAGGSGPGGCGAPAPRCGSRGGRGGLAPQIHREGCCPPHPPASKKNKTIKKKKYTQPRKSRAFLFFPPPSLVPGTVQKPPSTPQINPNPQNLPKRPRPGCRAGSLPTHHLLFIGKSEWSHFVAYAARLYL